MQIDNFMFIKTKKNRKKNNYLKRKINKIKEINIMRLCVCVYYCLFEFR
jgi:hypothetical protein